ncbi:MAG: DUF4465 domain-containing protein [Planctomycetota bacterium]
MSQPGPFGQPESVGTFASGGVEFSNAYTPAFGSWRGFSVSNVTNTTTPGPGNDGAAFTGGGAAGPGGTAPGTNYAVAFGSSAPSIDANDAVALAALPTIFLGPGLSPVSMLVTNTTYAALSMLNGDAFAKQFGGPTGNEPDFFTLSIYGIDANGVPLANSVDFALADYTFADNSEDFIVDSWTEVDLTSLAGAETLHFGFTSSDVGAFGINTPVYVAIDDLTLSSAAVPEPGSLVLLSVAASGMSLGVLRRRVGSRRKNEGRDARGSDA